MVSTWMTVYALHPWHRQNIPKDFIEIEMHGDSWHENMDPFLDHPETTPFIRSAF